MYEVLRHQQPCRSSCLGRLWEPLGSFSCLLWADGFFVAISINPLTTPISVKSLAFRASRRSYWLLNKDFQQLADLLELQFVELIGFSSLVQCSFLVLLYFQSACFIFRLTRHLSFHSLFLGNIHILWWSRSIEARKSAFHVYSARLHAVAKK